MTTVLITGQQWVSDKFCEEFYGQKIRNDFAAGKRFAIGGAEGADAFGQNLLISLCVASNDENSFKRVTVYMKGEREGRLDPRFQLKNGYPDFPSRDIAMGLECDEVIYCAARFECGVTGAQLPWLIVIRKQLCARAGLKVELNELVVECRAICDAMRNACEPYSDEIAKPVKAVYAEHYRQK